MIKQTLWVSIGAILLLSGCAKMNAVSNSNAAVKAKQASDKTNQAIELTEKGADTAKKLEQVYKKDVSPLWEPLPNKEATENMKKSNPTITKVLNMIACAPNNIAHNNGYKNKFFPYVTKDSSSEKIVFPIVNSKITLEEEACLEIQKIGEYKKISKNVFAFNVLYAKSDEKYEKSAQYKMVKASNGKWLFKF